MKHIVGNEGVFKTFEELSADFDVNKIYFMLYLGIVNAIPNEWTKKIRGKSTNDLGSQCFIYLNNKKIDILDAKGDKIYNHLILKKHDKSKACLKYTDKFGIDDEEWKIIYLIPSKVGVSNKAKENQYKIIHDYVPTNKLLFKMKIRDSPRCNFCNLYVQDTYHLLFNCLIVKNFWFRVVEWFSNEQAVNVNIELRNVMFGSDTFTNLINKVILYGKLYILKCKYKDLNPNIEHFVTYLNYHQIL